MSIIPLVVFAIFTVVNGVPSSTHWAVITSINSPTLAIQQLASLDGWAVVVVGDAKSPVTSAWSELPTVVYLDLDAQAQLGYNIIPLLPMNHYARKVRECVLRCFDPLEVPNCPSLPFAPALWFTVLVCITCIRVDLL